ncbi:MAG: S8 family serine peptidase [Candidatus Marinamargulisbacteria bacterium]
MALFVSNSALAKSYFVVLNQPATFRSAENSFSAQSLGTPSIGLNINIKGLLNSKLHSQVSQPSFQLFLESIATKNAKDKVPKVSRSIKGSMSEYTYIVSVDANSEEAFESQVKALDSFVYMQPNYVYELQSTGTSEPAYSTYQSIDFELMKIDQVWSFATGQGQKIAVLDTGINLNHDEFCSGSVLESYTNQSVNLNGCTKVIAPYDAVDFTNVKLDDCNMINGVDYYDPDGFPHDDQGHGSHVAGIIAASKNNVGIIGVAYDAQIIPVRVLAKCIKLSNGRVTASGTTESIINGINHAVQNGATIINLSLGGPSSNKKSDSFFQQAILNAVNAGVTVIAAAGNEQLNIDHSSYPPASLENVIAVSSVSNTGIFASNYSNYGNKIDVAAVGGNSNGCVYSAYYGNTNKYERMCGTSMAAPYVSGYAALLNDYYQNQKGITLTPIELRRLIQLSGSLAPNHSITIGYGIIDATKGFHYAGAAIDISTSLNASSTQFLTSDNAHRFLCYPNPLYRSKASSTACDFYYSKPANISVAIYSRRGQKVMKDSFIYGAKELVWDGRDMMGKPLPNGVYQMVLTIQPTDGSTTITKKHLITLL